MMAITDIDMVAFGNAKVISRDPPTFQCQHEEKECYGNMVELCAIQRFPKRYWDFVVCEEKQLDFSEDGIVACACEGDIEPAEILECMESGEGARLHLEAADRTPDHTYVPYVLVDGKELDDPSNLVKMVCEAFEGKKPKSCAKYMNLIICFKKSQKTRMRLDDKSNSSISP